MSLGAAARAALLAGGLLVAAGSFLPELEALASRLFFPGAPKPVPDRSHWVVFWEAADMLAHPDPTLPRGYYVYYAAQAVALAYLALAGVAFAASAFWGGSRLAAGAMAAVHALAFAALAAADALLFASGLPLGRDSGASAWVLALVPLLLALLAAETVLAARALSARSPRRSRPADAVNLLPAAFLLPIHAGLYLRLRESPNWPAGGYLAAAIGCLLSVAGILLLRGAPSSEALSGGTGRPRARPEGNPAPAGNEKSSPREARR
mgnify:CR=1 FL=1